MSTSPTAHPVVRNAGTRPLRPRKLFVNIAVADLQRAIDFFEQLGFAFNPQFTDPTAAAMLVGEDAYFMLLTREKFASFSCRPPSDPDRDTEALYAFSVEGRADVDEIVAKALAAGGAPAGNSQDHGFMYQSSFFDPDGHHFEVFWMDPAVAAG